MTADRYDSECPSHFTLMQACMVLYRDLGDRPFPWELWRFLEEVYGDGPLMVRFGRFGRASFCVVVRKDLFRSLDWSSLALYAPVSEDALLVRLGRFKITVGVNFKYWFVWKDFMGLESWIERNSYGYRAVNWPEADRLRRRIVTVFQKACRLHVLDVSGNIGNLGSV